MTDKEAIDNLKNYIECLMEDYGYYKDIVEFRDSVEHLEKSLQTQQAEIEKKDEWINKLENKLMYALTPTKHELAKRTQEEFKEIIRKNIDEDTYTIKRKLKENWSNL